MSDLYNIGLPKWPALVVVGDNVTKDQAAEILVRTQQWMPFSNDRQWTAEIRLAFDMPEADMRAEYAERRAQYDREYAFAKSIGCLGLEYLTNNQIASSWIGGPHGWCDWSGNIGCHNYNIGKWPSVETVHKEWIAIAEAFPYLTLRSQLFSEESGGDEDGRPGVPLVEFFVAEGKAAVVEPGPAMKAPVFDMNGAVSVMMVPPSFRERGCTIEQLKRGVELARKRVANV